MYLLYIYICVSHVPGSSQSPHGMVPPYLAVYVYPKPVYVLPIAHLTYDLSLIVCKLYTKSVPMHI